MLVHQPTERLIGFAQVALSALYIAAYFAVLVLFLTGVVHPPKEWKEVLISLISVLTGGVLLILQFWFSRGRPQGTELPTP